MAAPQIKPKSLQEQAHSGTKWVGLLFIFAAIFLVFMAVTSPSKKNIAHKRNQSLDPHSSQVQAAVNDHLKMTSLQIEQAEQAAQIENMKLKNSEYRNTTPQDTYSPEAPSVSYEAESHWDDLASKLRRGNSNAGTEWDPADNINYELFQQQKLNEYTASYKKAYAEAFVENARRHGYLIELTEDYRVKSVQKIKNKVPTIFEEQ